MPNWKKVVVSGSDATLNNITATGDVTVQGDLIAENYIISSSVTHVTQSFSSGSTIFGDTNDDTHQFTGSIQILHTGSGYGLELSGSSFYVDAGSSGSAYLGTHNVGVDLSIPFNITGSGLIVSQSDLPQYHYNMVKVGDIELVDFNGGTGINKSFLIDVKHDRALIISSSNTNVPVANIEVNNHKFYGTLNNVIANFGANSTIANTSNISLTADNNLTLASNQFFIKAGSAEDDYIPNPDKQILVSQNESTTAAAQFKPANMLESFPLFGGAITASAVSSSGLLLASLSEDTAGSYNNSVVYDTATGQFYYTGSYGGGGGGATPGGSAGSIQYNDGSNGFDGQAKFKYDDTNNRLIIESVGTPDSMGLGFETSKPHLVGGTDSNFFLSERHGALNNFGVFDRLKRFLCLQPIASNTSNTHIPSARLHILDNPTDSGNPITKIINQNNKGTYNLLMGTAATANSLGTGQHKFISFYINSDNDGGNTPLNGAIYFDPSGGLGGGNPSVNTVLFHGIFSSPSDKKLKKHITFTKKGIEDIMSFKVKDFRWKEDDKTTDKTTGLIAQDLIESHPYLVRELEGKLSVDYQGIIPLLIKAVQDQQEQINELKEQLKNK